MIVTFPLSGLDSIAVDFSPEVVLDPESALSSSSPHAAIANVANRSRTVISPAIGRCLLM